MIFKDLIRLRARFLFRKPHLLLAALLGIKFLLQYFLVHEVYELHRDEFLHLDQANHLAWGYFSVPPFTSWVAWVIRVLGNTEFWVRFFPALFGALTLVVVWKTIEYLKGNLYALMLGALCVLFSPLLRLNGLFQPNSFDVLAWTTLYFLLIRYLDSRKGEWLIAGGVVLALGFLNKYNILFWALGIFPALCLSAHRSLFLRKAFYLSVFVALLLVLPNLLWQYRHDFPVLHHMALLRKYQLVHVERFDFLKDQFYYCIAALPVFVASVYALWAYPPFSRYRLWVWNIIFTLGVFAFFRAKSYYAFGLYPIYISWGAVYLEKALAQGWKRFLRPVVAAWPVVILGLVIPLEFPVKTPGELVEFAEKNPALGMHRWEDGKKYPLSQDFADMLGWKELAEKTGKIRAALPVGEPVLILCDNYGQAGAINYYSGGRLKADAFNADYLGWFDLTLPYRHLIRIKDAGNREDELAETLPYFESGRLVDSVANPYAREYKTDIFVFENAKINVNERIRAEIRSVASE